MTWEERYKLLQEFCEHMLMNEYNTHGKGDPEELMSPFARGIAQCFIAGKIIADGEMDSVEEEGRVPVLLIKMINVLLKMSKDSEPKCEADIGAQKECNNIITS